MDGPIERPIHRDDCFMIAPATVPGSHFYLRYFVRPVSGLPCGPEFLAAWHARAMQLSAPHPGLRPPLSIKSGWRGAIGDPWILPGPSPSAFRGEGWPKAGVRRHQVDLCAVNGLTPILFPPEL